MRPIRQRLLIALPLLLLLAMIVLAALLPREPSRIFLNQFRAVKSIQEVNLAQQDYAKRNPNAGFACRLADLGEQNSAATSEGVFVDGVLASGTKAGYEFQIRCLASSTKKWASYTITAVPTRQGITGEYALCSDNSGEIWYSENGSAPDCLQEHKPVGRSYR